MKKGLRLLAFILMASVLVTGCQKGKETKAPEDEVKGRYIEEEIKISEEGLSMISGLIRKPEGGFELYGYEGEKQCLYISGDGRSWKQAEFPQWLETTEKENLGIVRLGEDGCYYALKVEYGEEDGIGYMKQHILRSEDGKTGTEVKLPVLEELRSDGDEYRLYNSFSNIQILENGNLTGIDSYGGQVQVFSPEGKEVLQAEIINPFLATEVDDCYTVQGNTIIGVKKGSQELLFFDGSTGKEIRSVEFPFSGSSKIGTLEDGTTLIADKKGIHRLEPEGTLWQTVVDGELTSISMPTTEISQLIPIEGEQESYLLRCGTRLFFYTYDAAVAAVPEKELTVYSLRENATVRQAVVLFQQKHKDVRVHYTVGMEESNEDKKEDYIRAFNAELLDGNGADIIILDELPYTSYIEKGILEELSGVVDTSALLPQFARESEEGAGLYALPLRVRVPLVFGKKEAVENSRNIEQLLDYIEENGKKDYIRRAGVYQVLDFFLTVCEKQLLTEEGKIEEAEARVFLEQLLAFLENSGVKESEPEELKSNLITYSVRPNLFSNPASMITGTANAYVTTENGFIGLYIVKALEDKVKELNWDILGNTLLASGRVGLNKQSANQELASEFISFLFSEEVQEVDVYDGFPVNKNALEKLAAKEPQEDMWIGGATQDENGNYVELNGNAPSVKMKQQVVEKMLAAESISGQRDTLYDLIFNEITPLLDGERTIEETLEALTGKVNTYVAE